MKPSTHLHTLKAVTGKEKMGAEVSTVRCGSYEVEEVYSAVRRSIELIGGIESFVKDKERVLIKPNLLGAKPRHSAVTTDPAIVGALIRIVKEAGGVPLVGDSPGLGTAAKVAAKNGLREEVERLGAKLIELSTPVEVRNTKGLRFKKLVVAEEALDVDVIINAPKLKTHAQMFLTMAVKNIFGCVPGKRKVQWHLTAGVDSDYFADMLLELALFIKPRLSILDAVISMEGNGPASGTPRETGFVMASTEPIALDRAACEVLKANPEDMPTLKRAKEHGLGTTDIDKIELLGDATSELEVTDFEFPPLISTNFTASLPGFIDKRLRKAASSRPFILTSKCMLCNVCVAVCPAEVMENTNQMRINIDYNGCIRCFCCQEMCPHNAITVKEGWLKRLIPGL